MRFWANPLILKCVTENTNMNITEARTHLLEGQVIPAMPLALNEDGTWSERHQRALARYYVDAGAGGLAVGVHSTQFEIREPFHGLFEPVLQLCSEEIDNWLGGKRPFLKVSGICGETKQAVAEAELARNCGYSAGLLSMTAMKDASLDEKIAHCREVADVIPVIGFYLQATIGGCVYSYEFWKKFAEIENVIAIKMAPFDRYATLDVIRAVADSGRDDIALYTGNDDNIINDLLTPFSINGKELRIVGGLLGQWAMWTERAVAMLAEIKIARDASDGKIESEWLSQNAHLTDANGVIFDAGNQFRGCIPGIMEILRRQGLVPSIRCLNPREILSPGQSQELDRITAAYPELQDDEFVRTNLDRWLS